MFPLVLARMHDHIILLFLFLKMQSKVEVLELQLQESHEKITILQREKEMVGFVVGFGVFAVVVE